MGLGSVGNEFVFEQFSREPGDVSTFALQATFALRKKNVLQLREEVVDTEIEITLPVQPSQPESASTPVWAVAEDGAGF
jgi:hypothetical protein